MVGSRPFTATRRKQDSCKTLEEQVRLKTGLMILTQAAPAIHTVVVLQLIFKTAGDGTGTAGSSEPATLADLSEGQQGVLERLDAPEDIARRLMELGFLPGSIVTAARSAPGGDPRVFRVDGSEFALRRETAAHIRLRRNART